MDIKFETERGHREIESRLLEHLRLLGQRPVSAAGMVFAWDCLRGQQCPAELTSLVYPPHPFNDSIGH